MKKTYITPLNKVLQMAISDGILSATSSVKTLSGFDNDLQEEVGDGGDYGRQDSGSSSLWDQSWQD